MFFLNKSTKWELYLQIPMLDEYKNNLLQTIITVSIFLGVIFIYKTQNRFAFPGLIERGLFALSLLTVLFILFSLQYNRLISRLRIRLERMEIKYYKLPLISKLLTALNTLSFKSSDFITRKGISFIFQFLLVAFLLILLLKEFIEVSLNINYLLISVIFFGILNVFFPAENTPKSTEINKKDYYLIVLLGIIGTILIFIKTKQLGLISYLISLIAGILIITLSFLVLGEEDES